MLSKVLLSPILDDEGLTRGLGDPEARVLVEWLVDQAEHLAAEAPSASEASAGVGRLCRRARAISRFVSLWCLQGQQGAACQLAASERFLWPLPTPRQDPYVLMQRILRWETQSQQPSQ